MAGWIKLHRKMTNWEWFDDHNTFRLFMYLLMTANHTDTEWRGTKVPAGSVLTGRESLAAKTGMSEQQVRTSLRKLKSTGEITSKTTNKFSVISITNWADYQDSNQQATSKPTSNPTNNLTSKSTSKKEGEKPAKSTTNKHEKDDSNQQPNQQPNQPNVTMVTTSKEVKKLRSKESSKEKCTGTTGGSNVKDHDFSRWPDAPEANVLDDYKKTRKTRLTQTAIDRMAKEIWKAWEAGLHPDDCLAVCCEAGWQGFKFDWYVNREQRNEKNSRSGSGLTGASKRAADHHETLKRYAEGGASSVLDSEDF